MRISDWSSDVCSSDLSLWPRARAIASDIDPASIRVTRENAAINGVALGRTGGRLALAVAPGTDHPAIRRRAPYDLVVANILAGPLITLAPDIAAATAPGDRKSTRLNSSH